MLERRLSPRRNPDMDSLATGLVITAFIAAFCFLCWLTHGWFLLIAFLWWALL